MYSPFYASSRKLTIRRGGRRQLGSYRTAEWPQRLPLRAGRRSRDCAPENKAVAGAGAAWSERDGSRRSIQPWAQRKKAPKKAHRRARHGETKTRHGAVAPWRISMSRLPVKPQPRLRAPVTAEGGGKQACFRQENTIRHEVFDAGLGGGTRG